jgi:hypothetical protein
MDTEPAPYAAGEAEAAPSGFFNYKGDPKKPRATQSARQAKKIDALTVALGKEAAMDTIPHALDYVGTSSDIAPTTVTQLKWDKSLSDVPLVGDGQASNSYTRTKVKKEKAHELRKRI